MDACSKCGSPLRSEARFCPHCGNQVERPSLHVEPERAAADTSEAPPASEVASSYEPVLLAIERLFRYLNKGMETQNRQNISDIRQGYSRAGLMGRLSTMCRALIRQIVEDYAAERTEKYLVDDELESAMVLADYAMSHSGENQYINAQKSWCALEALRLAQAGQLAPSAIVGHVHERCMEHQPESAAPAGTPLWTEIAQVITSYLKEQRRANNLMPETASQWIEAFSAITEVSEAARKALLEAASQHIPHQIDALGFLKQEERARLLDYTRHLRFDQIRMLLHHERSALLQAFSEALSDPFFGQVLPPRKSTHVVYHRVELIPEIKRLMASQDEGEPRRALQLLENAQKDIVDREHAPIVREWLLYVRARLQGLNRAIQDWQADFTQGTASWEEVWNLAVALFHEVNALQALQVLIPGLKSQRAPFSHLRFGLFCAVAMLRRETSYPKATIEMVETFLLDNLLKLPLSISYLTWLWLANDTPEPLDPQEQRSVIDTFQEILDRPIVYNPPARPAREISIAEFEREFQELLSTVHKLERDYVLEPVPKQEKIKIKTRMLETCILVSGRTSRRVGIFVDYENLILSLPGEMRNRTEMIAKTLLDHGASYGVVVGGWICYSPANLRNISESELVSKFRNAGFKIEVPRGKTGILRPRENQSDIVLLECITTAMIDSKLDVYVIVSGDHLYYERIRRLLEQGHAVCVISYPRMLSGRYSSLLDSIQKSYMPEEYGEFTIDALNDVFHFTPEQIMALEEEIKKREEEKSARK